MGVLEHHPQGPAQIRLADLVDVDAVVADLSVLDVIETVDQVGDGGLSGPGGAHQGDLLPRFGVHPDVVEHHFLVGVPEIHPVEHDPALHPLVGDGAVRLVGVLPGPDAGAAVGGSDGPVGLLPGADQLHVPAVLLRRLVHELKDPLGPGGGHDHKVQLLADLGDGLVEILVQPHKGDDRAYGGSAESGQGQESARGGADHIAQIADVGVDGHEKVGVAVRLVGAVPQRLVEPPKLLDGGFLVAEDLDHLLAVHHLLDVSVQIAQVALLLLKILPRQPREGGGDFEHHQGDEHGDDGQGQV